MNPILQVYTNIILTMGSVLSPGGHAQKSHQPQVRSPKIYLENEISSLPELSFKNTEVLVLSKTPRTYTESELFCRNLFGNNILGKDLELSIWKHGDLENLRNFKVFEKLSLWTSSKASQKQKALVVYFYQSRRGIAYQQSKEGKNGVVCRAKYNAQSVENVALNDND